MFSGNSGNCRILTLLMQMVLCFDLEISVGNYLRIFLAEGWTNEKKLYLGEIKLQLKPCNPGRNTY